jgi:integrase/recombinase XerD
MPSSWLIGNSTYLLHLVQEKHVSWSVFNQTVAALRFLYEVTLDRAGVMVRIRCPKQPKRLPIVLSLDEMARFFAAVIGIKHRAILMTAYGAGLRHSEVVALRVEDIDSHCMVLRVRQGKGRKDRYVMLSPRLLALLREYWKVARPTDWLFPGDVPGHHITGRSVHRVCVQAARDAGLGKPASTTRTSTVSCQAAGCRLTARSGSLASPGSSSRCACSAACSGASSWRCSAAPSIKGSSPSTGSSPPWRTRASWQPVIIRIKWELRTK